MLLSPLGIDARFLCGRHGGEALWLEIQAAWLQALFWHHIMFFGKTLYSNSASSLHSSAGGTLW